MQKIIRKAPLTLIEVCIALGLMSIIVYTLFSSLIQTIRISKSLDTIKTTALKSSFVYDRLLTIFSHTNPDSFQLEKKEDGTLSKISFSFENGLDSALIYSGTTEAEIYSDHNHNLILNIFSKDKAMVQSEILLTDVKEYSLDSHLPFFLTLQIQLSKTNKREFVFFFSDRSEEIEAYTL